MAYIIGSDVGGTCTDCVVVDEQGRLTLGKAFSTPPDFSKGILDATLLAAEGMGLELQDLLRETTLFLHGTTVAENAIVDKTLAKAGLVTTKGFEETLFATRGGYGRWSGLTDDEKRHPIRTDKPEPLIPLDMIKGVRERTDHRGRILVNLNEDEVREAVQELVKNGAEAIGVCFLWSFRNPENESSVKEIIRKLRPEIFVTVSHELVASLGEYERTSSVALNSCLGPPVSKYLNSLKERLDQHGFRGSLLVMQAYGGLLPVSEASKVAIGIIESGPVSGLVGSKFTGDLIGMENVIATDMGGTTFKVGVVRKGMIEYQREPSVLRYHYLLPKMDVISLGLAGGSIVWIDPRLNHPRIGPKSAGAYPGPVCYDFIGEEPTVTDVDLILGYLDPRYFLGGRAKLNKEKAVRVFKAKVADPLGLGIMEAAAAIYKLANNMIYDLLHKTTVERGLDPRKYGLFAFGGSAGMHAATYGEALGVERIVIPNTASVHGAFGLVSSETVHEYQVTHRMRVPVETGEVNAIFADLESRAVAQLKLEGFPNESIIISRSIDMRYGRQVHIVTAPIEAAGPLSESDLGKAYARFEELYEEKYGKGSAYKEAGMDIISFRLRATGLLRKPQPYKYPLAGSNPEAAFIEKKAVYFEKVRDLIEVNIYDFQGLMPGNELLGPTVILTPITTIVVRPGQRASCDEYKNIIITYK